MLVSRLQEMWDDITIVIIAGGLVLFTEEILVDIDADHAVLVL